MQSRAYGEAILMTDIKFAAYLLGGVPWNVNIRLVTSNPVQFLHDKYLNKLKSQSLSFF
jgi:hypothetical protein